MRRHLTGSPRALAIVLAVATAGFLVVAFLQGKGWRYHFLPSVVVGSLLIATLHVCSPPTNELVRRLYRLAGVLTVVVLLGLGLRDAATRVVRPADPALVGDPNFRALLAIASATPTGETVAVLSTNIASGFPLILVADTALGASLPEPLAAGGTVLRPGAGRPARPVP